MSQQDQESTVNDAAHVDEIDMEAAHLKFTAARVVASQKYMPYLASALFSMTSVPLPGSGTFASDARWRLYWDPAVVLAWDVNEVAFALLHEVGHCLRGHAPRFAAMKEPYARHRIWNYAADTLINEDLRQINVPIPPIQPWFLEMVEGAEIGMPTEQVYRLLVDRALEEQRKACTCNQGKPDSDADSDSDSGAGSDAGEQNSDGSGSQSDTGSGSGDGDKDGSQSGTGSQPGNESGDKAGAGEGEQNNDSGNESGESGAAAQGQNETDTQNGSATGNTSGQGQRDPNCPVHGDHEHGNGHTACGCDNAPNTGSTGQPGADWDCGSAADGVRRNYETAGENTSEGVDEYHADLIRQQVAVSIMQHVKNRGDVPGGYARWAENLLDPVVDWRRELAAIVRRVIANIAGRKDYSYSRPSRRQAAMRGTGQNIIMPAMRQPAPPSVAIVFDTSGSMNDDMLTWGITEAEGVIRAVSSNGRGVQVIPVDAKVHAGKTVRRAADIELAGGGGTDMRVGINAALEARPRPQVIVVITDGYTPWPTEPIKGVTLIAALTTDTAANDVPSWAKTLHIAR